MRNSKIYTIVILVLGHIFVAILSFGRGVFQEPVKQKIFHILADAFFVPSVFLIGVGLLSLIARDGQFDGLKYSLYLLREKFSFLRKDKKTADFGEFRDRQKRKTASVWPLLGPGLYFLAVSLIFTLLFNMQVQG